MKTSQKKQVIFYTVIGISLLLVLSFIVLWQMDFFKEKVVHSGYPVRYEYGELIERSHLVVRGKITDKSKAITVIPANHQSDPELYTEYTLEISDTLRGEKQAGESITVRVRGGETFTQVSYDEDVPTIKVGDEVVAFLHQYNVGANYITKGDFYSIVAFDQGWYNLKKDDEGKEILVSQIERENLVWDEVKAFIPEFSKTHPIDYDRTRKEAMARYKSRLESGEYTQEQYDEMVAALDRYATIKE